MPVANTPIKVLSVNDHPLLREGIAAVLEGQQDMVLVGEATNGRDAIETFRAHRPKSCSRRKSRAKCTTQASVRAWHEFGQTI